MTTALPADIKPTRGRILSSGWWCAGWLLVALVLAVAPSPASGQPLRRELAVVDGAIPDYERLIADLSIQAAADRTLDVVVLDPTRSGLAQISEALASRGQLAAVHLFTHGNDGALLVGDTLIDTASLAANARAVRTWGAALAPDGDLLLYGCNVARSTTGRAFVEALAALTGADVAASVDVTGSGAAGGDWELEAISGRIEASLVVGATPGGRWNGVLLPNTGTAVFSNNSSTPQQSAWNGATFGTTSGTAALPDRYRIMQGADAPTRNEKIVVGIDASGNVTGVMWNGTSWSALPINNLGTVSETYWWGADVAYEQVSGDALVVWNDNSQAAGQKLRYAVWTGSSWSTPQSIAAYTGTEPQNVTLATDPASDAMVLYVNDVAADDYALVWNGSSWGNAITLDTSGTAENDQNTLGVAFEARAGRAMVAYNKDLDPAVYFRIWNGTSWSAEASVAAPAGVTGEARTIFLAGDYTSNRIVLGAMGANREGWVNVWDGGSWGTSVQVETSIAGTYYHNVAVAFERRSGQALVAYAESAQSLVRYRTWDASAGWSAELTGPTVGAEPNDLILLSAPTGDGIMLAVQDGNSDAHYALWSGSAWGAVTTLSTNTGEVKNEPFTYIWDVNPSTVGALIWRTSADTSPNAREWTGSVYTAASDSVAIGSLSGLRVAEAPTRDEFIVIGRNTSGNIVGELWDGTSWSTLAANPLGSYSPASSWMADVAYESVRGNAMMVWGTDTALRFSVWNGTSWTAAANLSDYWTLSGGTTAGHVRLAAKPAANEIVLAVTDNLGKDYAYVWNGTSWGAGLQVSTGSGSSSAVAYEQGTGRAMIAYANAASPTLYYRIWNGSSWSAPSSVALTGVGGGFYPAWVNLAADPTSNRIAVAVTPSGLAGSVQYSLNVWDGSAWVAGQLATSSGIDQMMPGIDVAFERVTGDLLAAYGVSGSAVVRYRTWTAAGGWSAEQNGPTLGAAARVVDLVPDPYSDRVMLSEQDGNNDLYTAQWSGTAWGSPTTIELNTGETNQQPFAFVWTVEPGGITVTAGSAVTTTEAGGTALFTIVLTSQPTATSRWGSRVRTRPRARCRRRRSPSRRRTGARPRR